MKPPGLLVDADECGQALLRLLSRGHAIVAELQLVADGLPEAFLGGSAVAARFAPVLPDFIVFRAEGALEAVAKSRDTAALDEESRELHAETVARLFHLLAALLRYSVDLRKVLEDLETGVYISRSLESVLSDNDGAQLVSEAVALLGSSLLLMEERLPGAARERALVAHYRFTVGTPEAPDELTEVCRLFRSANRPVAAEMARRAAGYPETLFARFPLPPTAVRMLIGRLQTGDIYHAAQHYPLPEHRSHSLAAQAGLLYATLFFQPETLANNVVAMREIVNRHFSDAWVVAFSLGFTADLTIMWAPYPAAKQALDSGISPSAVTQLRDQYRLRLASTRQLLAGYLASGALTQEVMVQNLAPLLDCLRQANATIRWLLLQPTTSNVSLKAVLPFADDMKEQVFQALVDTALLEDRIQSLLASLVERRESDWAALRAEASQAMDDLALYFSGAHALKRNVKNEELECWFRGLQARIDGLNFEDSGAALLVLGRRITELHKALEEVEQFHEILRQPQIVHFLADARSLLQKMVRTISLRSETFNTILRVGDLSYAWNALDAYRPTMNSLLARSPRSVQGLRALFLRLASILDAPMQRIRQAKCDAYGDFVTSYYSRCLVQFMRSVLQEIPRLIFGLICRISDLHVSNPIAKLPPKVNIDDLHTHAERGEAVRYQVGAHIQQIAMLMRGIRETDVVVLGILRVDPRSVLADGLRRELAQRLSDLLGSLRYVPSSRTLSRQDFVRPLLVLNTHIKSLTTAFEHVQDYVGASALQMCHAEIARASRFWLHMELHLLLRRRKVPPQSSSHHDADCPIPFPDKAGAASGTAGHGGSFLSRTVGALLALTDPKQAVGGLYGEWRRPCGDEPLLEGRAFEALHAALGPPALAAISTLLGFRVARELRELLARLESKQVVDAVALFRFCGLSGSSRVTIISIRAVVQQSSAFLGSVFAALASIGRQQLLRRCIHDTLRLHRGLASSLAAQVFGALGDAELVESVRAELAEDQLPDIFDFLAGAAGGPTDGVKLSPTMFRKRIALIGELGGCGQPFRQLYLAITKGSAPVGIEVVLVSLFCAAASGNCGVQIGTRTFFRKTFGRTSGALVVAGGGDDVGGITETCAALVAGVATLLQQLPESVTTEVTELSALCLSGICAEGSEGKEESFTEGGRIVALMNSLLDLLGLPRDKLASALPQGLLDIWDTSGQ